MLCRFTPTVGSNPTVTATRNPRRTLETQGSRGFRFASCSSGLLDHLTEEVLSEGRDGDGNDDERLDALAAAAYAYAWLSDNDRVWVTTQWDDEAAPTYQPEEFFEAVKDMLLADRIEWHLDDGSRPRSTGCLRTILVQPSRMRARRPSTVPPRRSVLSTSPATASRTNSAQQLQRKRLVPRSRALLPGWPARLVRSSRVSRLTRPRAELRRASPDNFRALRAPHE